MQADTPFSLPGWAVHSGKRHRHGTIVAAILLAVMAAWLPEMTLGQQFWIVLLPVMAFGMSHGGADPIIMADLKRTLGRGNSLWLGSYCLLMLLAIAFIWWQPELALAGFLLMSVAHFATTDLPFLPPGAPRLAAWLSGSLPIVGPMAGHAEQVAVMFAWLLQYDPGALVTVVQVTGYALMAVWIMLFAVAIVTTRKRCRLPVLMELSTLAAVSVLLPPLLAFAFYFCAIHSIRHFIMLMTSLRARQVDVDIKKLARLATPATLGAIALSLGAWWFLLEMQPDREMAWLSEGVRVMFWGLAVLTVPHALLVALWSPPVTSRSPSQSPSQSP